MRIFLSVALGVACCGVSLRGEDSGQPGTWDIARLKNEPPPMEIVDQSGPIHSLLYKGDPVAGISTEVFAFYASPQTLGKATTDESFPGIVLIHGGGGTAFSDWVWLWAKRGYAAIAMDLSGHRPPAPTYNKDGEKISDANHSREARTRLEHGGLDHGHDTNLDPSAELAMMTGPIMPWPM